MLKWSASVRQRVAQSHAVDVSPQHTTASESGGASAIAAIDDDEAL